jgi:YidC/Oxa1 family membrane protein insertase
MFAQLVDFSGNFLGSFLYNIYNFTGRDYGFALIIFTIIVKLILMPLNIKQIKSSMKMTELQPELKKLQDKYKDDKEKLNEEMVKFFKTNNYNPANGCIMSFIQLPILIMLWQVISKPITFMLNGGQYVQIMLDYFNSLIKDSTPKIIDETSIIFSFAQDKITALADKGIPEPVLTKIIDLQNGMHFLGIFNLAKVPSYKPELLKANPEIYLPLIFIVVMAALFTYISSAMMIKAQNTKQIPVKESKKQDSPMPFDPAQTQKTMLLIGPIMTLIFAFQLPAGLSLYWLAGYVFQVFQQLYINKTIYANKTVVDLNKKEV